MGAGAMSGRFFMGLGAMVVAGFSSAPAFAQIPADVDIPHVGPAGREAFATEYRAAPLPKAFVIGPGGSWAWTKGRDSAEDALADALERCDRLTSHCVPFARDDRIVFDRAAWAHALAPYPDPQAPAAKTVGWGMGERYFDLALTLPDGRRASVGALKGKLVVLQFWGSWCPPCRVEMPDFEKLYDKFKDSPDIVFLLVNYREEGAVGRRWAARQEVKLPLADSGSRGREDNNLYLAVAASESSRRSKIEGGGDSPAATPIPYGQAVALAQVPTTLILDRHGLMLFRKSGAADSWVEMEGQIRHAIEYSAR